MYIIIGNTGVGKSTFCNFLLGCKMKIKDGKLIAENERFKIGHGLTNSATFFPRVEINDKNMCITDTAGFYDDRGPVVDIVNVINLKKLIKFSKSVCFLPVFG